MTAPQNGAAVKPAQYAIFEMACGYWVSQSLYVAAKLGIADLVVDGPKTAEELAAATKMHGPSLYRLLRALASKGVFAEDAERRFGLTPAAECLLNRPGSQRAMVLMMGEEHYRAYGELLYSIESGKPSFAHVFGAPISGYRFG